MKTSGARLGRDAKNNEKRNGLCRDLTNTATSVGYTIPVRLKWSGIEKLFSSFQAYEKNNGITILVLLFPTYIKIRL